MGFLRSLIGWIFIIYGFFSILNATLNVIGANLFTILFPTFTFVEDVLEPSTSDFFLTILVIFGFLWGIFWIWLGNKVRTGGQ